MSDEYFIRIARGIYNDFNFATGGIETCGLAAEEVVWRTIDALGLAESPIGLRVRLEIETQRLDALCLRHSDAAAAVEEQRGFVNHLKTQVVNHG